MRKYLVVFILLLSTTVHAEDIWISQSGGTACSQSTQSAAWFNTAANWGGGVGEIDPGDTVYLCNTITSDLIPPANGLSGNNVIIDGTNATLGTSVNVYISGRSYLTFQNLTYASGAGSGSNVRILEIRNSSYITVDGLTAPNSPNPVDQSGDESIVLRNSSFITLNNFTFDNSGRTVLNGFNGTGEQNDNITFDGWYIRTQTGQLMIGGVPAERDLVFLNSINNLLVRDSYFERRYYSKSDDFCSGTCAHQDMFQFGSGGYSTNITFRNNYFKDNATGVVSNDQVAQMIIQNSACGELVFDSNIFEYSGNTGGYAMMYLGWKSVCPNTMNIRMYGNTIVDKATNSNDGWTHLLFLGQTSGSGDLIDLKNNVIYVANTSFAGRIVYPLGSATFTHDYNSYYGGGSTSYNGTTCTSYKSSNEYCSSDPLFLDYANDDFRIGTSSPAYDNGVDLGSSYNSGLSTDSTSFPNPALVVRATPWDIGAYEVGGDSTPPQRSGSSPGSVPSGTTQATIGLTTSENATCRYDTSSGVAYDNMVRTFGGAGTTSHSVLVGGTTYTDDFNRSNENPLSGSGKWVQVGTSEHPLQLSDNVVKGTYNLGRNAMLYDESFPPDQCSSVTVNDNSIGPAVRAESGGTYNKMYVFRAGHPPEEAGLLKVYCYDGTQYGYGSWSVSGSISPGDTLKLCAEGDQIKPYVNDVIVPGLTVTNSILSTGSPGLYTWVNDATADDWVGDGVYHLADGNNYSFYVRCSDNYGNKNTDDYLISFSVQQSGPRALGEFTIQGVVQ
jgi:hypothetical protein